MESYFEIDAINATSLKHGALSMLHMRHAMTTKTAPTAAMQLGTLIHAAILEPLKLASISIVWDGGDRRGKAWLEFAEAHKDKIILKPNEMEHAAAILSAVRRCQQAQDLLSGCEFERVLEWEGKYGKAKGRLDAIKRNRIVDVKTVANINPRAIQSQAFRLGYDIQIGWYAEGAEKCGFGTMMDDCWLLYVETKPPYDVLPMRIDSMVIQSGQSKAIKIAERYRACEASGVFPGVAEFAPTLTVPIWEADDLSGFDEEEAMI